MFLSPLCLCTCLLLPYVGVAWYIGRVGDWAKCASALGLLSSHAGAWYSGSLDVIGALNPKCICTWPIDTICWLACYSGVDIIGPNVLRVVLLIWHVGCAWYMRHWYYLAIFGRMCLCPQPVDAVCCWLCLLHCRWRCWGLCALALDTACWL